MIPPSVYRLTKDALTIMENYGVYAKETGFEKEIPNYLAQVKKTIRLMMLCPCSMKP